MAETEEQTEKPVKPRLKLLVIRHAIAADPAEFAKSGRADALRPLTRPGRKKMRRAAQGLARLVPHLDVLATSPLTRAVETGNIIARQYGFDSKKIVQVPALSPGKSAGQVMDWLRAQALGAETGPDVVVALVGHEPGLGQMVSWMLTGLRESFIPMKKGAACLLEFPAEVKPARAKLLWALRPGQLRDLGGI